MVFLSDNGGASNNASNNGSLSSWKGSLFEGGIRVPFAMRWTGMIPAGQVYRHPVISLDIMATITAQAGVEVASERPLDGVNLLPYLQKKKEGAPHDQLFWRKFDQKGICIRAGDFKAVADRQFQFRGVQLFDLSNDVIEKNDLASQRPALKNTLMQKYEAWSSQMQPTAFPTLGSDEWWRDAE